MQKRLRVLSRLAASAAIAAISCVASAAGASASPAVTRASGATVVPRTVPYQGENFIQNRYSGLCLDDPGQSSTPGQAMQQYTCNGTAAQLFDFIDEPSGYVEIVNVQNGLCLDQGNIVYSGAPIVQTYCNQVSPQQWTLSDVVNLPPYFWIQNHANPQTLLSVPDFGTSNGDPIQDVKWHGTANQQWWVAPDIIILR